MSFSRRCRLAHKNQAAVGIVDVKFGHAVLPVEQIPNFVPISEVLHVLPKRCNAGHFDIDFGVPTNASLITSSDAAFMK